MNISKTQAIKAARKFVSNCKRISSTNYIVYGPFDVHNPSGPTTEHQADSYTKALADRTQWVARIALAMMGRLNDQAEYAIWCYIDKCYGGSTGTVADIVDAGLQA